MNFWNFQIVKFICKEFWSNVFGKQVDNLRTNHAVFFLKILFKKIIFKILIQKLSIFSKFRGKKIALFYLQGVYVVQDNNFSMLRTFSDSTQFTKDIGIYLAFPSGVIRGALACLNIQVDFISNLWHFPEVMKLIFVVIFRIINRVMQLFQTLHNLEFNNTPPYYNLPIRSNAFEHFWNLLFFRRSLQRLSNRCPSSNIISNSPKRREITVIILQQPFLSFKN